MQVPCQRCIPGFYKIFYLLGLLTQHDISFYYFLTCLRLSTLVYALTAGKCRHDIPVSSVSFLCFLQLSTLSTGCIPARYTIPSNKGVFLKTCNGHNRAKSVDTVDTTGLPRLNRSLRGLHQSVDTLSERRLSFVSSIALFCKVGYRFVRKRRDE